MPLYLLSSFVCYANKQAAIPKNLGPPCMARVLRCSGRVRPDGGSRNIHTGAVYLESTRPWEPSLDNNLQEAKPIDRDHVLDLDIRHLSPKLHSPSCFLFPPKKWSTESAPRIQDHAMSCHAMEQVAQPDLPTPKQSRF